MMEQWKIYKEYLVSNTGKIISLNYNHTKKEKELKPLKHKDGYLYVNINGKQKSIHRLVATLFIENKFNKPYINHIDGNKENNNVKNLEWCTARENSIHAVNNNLTNFKTKKHIESAKKNINKAIESNFIKINMYDKNGKFLDQFNSIIEASRHTGANATHISLCAKGKQKSCGGYLWKYDS